MLRTGLDRKDGGGRSSRPSSSLGQTGPSLSGRPSSSLGQTGPSPSGRPSSSLGQTGPSLATSGSNFSLSSTGSTPAPGGRSRASSGASDHPPEGDITDDLDTSSYAGDDDSTASVAVVSLSERQSRTTAGRETMERKLTEFIRKVERWKSEKEQDVMSEVDSEYADAEGAAKSLIEQDPAGEQHNLLILGEQLSTMFIQYDTIEKIIGKEVARFEQEVFDFSDDTEELHRQYEILSNLEEMRKKQRPAYVAKQGDAVDDLIGQFLTKYQSDEAILPPNFSRLKEGLYEFGTKRIRAQILNGILVVRVGGGYMKFEEFVKKYAQKESIKVIKTPGFRATLIRSTSETHVNIIDPTPVPIGKVSKSVSAPYVPSTVTTPKKTPLTKSTPSPSKIPIASRTKLFPSKPSPGASPAPSPTPSPSPSPSLKSKLPPQPQPSPAKAKTGATTPRGVTRPPSSLSSTPTPTPTPSTPIPTPSAPIPTPGAPASTSMSSTSTSLSSLTPLGTPSPPSTPLQSSYSPSSSPSTTSWLDNAKDTLV